MGQDPGRPFAACGTYTFAVTGKLGRLSKITFSRV